MSTNELFIELSSGEAFRPLEEIKGRVRWNLEELPESVELQLFWFTRGKGTADIGVIATETFNGAARSDSRDFSFRLPAAPYSFSGRLISLIWALEVVAVPSDDVERKEIIVAPDKREILLSSPDGFSQSG